MEVMSRYPHDITKPLSVSPCLTPFLVLLEEEARVDLGPCSFSFEGETLIFTLNLMVCVCLCVGTFQCLALSLYPPISYQGLLRGRLAGPPSTYFVPSDLLFVYSSRLVFRWRVLLISQPGTKQRSRGLHCLSAANLTSKAMRRNVEVGNGGLRARAVLRQDVKQSGETGPDQ